MRVAFVFPCGHMLSTPCLVSLIKLLADNGIQIDVYTTSNDSSSWEGSFSELEGDNIRVLLYPTQLRSYKEKVPKLILGFGLWYMAKKASTNYDFTIAAGIRGLFIQGIENLLRKEPFIYLSLEMYFRDEMLSVKRQMVKTLEGFFNKRATLTLTQDDLRADVLARENGLDLHSVSVFPNSSLRNLSTKPNSFGSLKLAEKLGFAGKRVAIYPGSIFFPWAMTKELTEVTVDWPEDWMLLIHSRARLSDAQKFLPQRKQNELNKVVFSNTPLSGRDYDHMVEASDVGIALYDKHFSKNLYYLGYSSSKISDYLRLGKPVIVNDLPKIRELVQENQCGVVVRDVREIGKALQTIAADYERYSENALRTFEQFLDPERYMDDLLRAMRQIYNNNIKK
jgi:hypothetical protein